MNEDINSKIQRLAEQMKHQQAWHTISAKIGKKSAETSVRKASTEAKSSTEDKAAPKGSATTSPLAIASTEIKGTPSEMRGRSVPIGPRRVPQKPFAAMVVKDWYNSTLKQKNKEVYNRLNSVSELCYSMTYEL